MNKTGLVQEMANRSNLSKNDCKKALETFMEIVIYNLKNHEQTFLTGFGTFSILKKKQREGINPATQKRMIIQEQYITKFKASKAIKRLPRP